MNETLDSTGIADVICSCSDDSREVLGAVIHQVAEDKLCTDVIEAILKKKMTGDTVIIQLIFQPFSSWV